jgi:hypothetical protein
VIAFALIKYRRRRNRVDFMRVLTLAAGSFVVVGGRVKAVTLHLSAAARALLARSHVLRAQATIEAHDPAGATHTTQAVVTLRLGEHVNKR